MSIGNLARGLNPETRYPVARGMQQQSARAVHRREALPESLYDAGGNCLTRNPLPYGE
jgi:hypothetical protein